MVSGNKIPFIHEDMNMKRAVKIITNKKLGVLIAQNKSNNTTGIITDGNVRKLQQKNLNLNNIKIKTVMTRNPITVDVDTLAVKALRIMNEKKITSLCVHKNNKKNKTIGLVHIHHILDSNIE